MYEAWLSLKDRCDVSYADFCKTFADWENHKIVVNGKKAGSILIKENEIHACILPEFKGLWVNKSCLRLLNDTIKKYGFVKTKATTKDGEYFVKRLGFVIIGSEYIKGI